MSQSTGQEPARKFTAKGLATRSRIISAAAELVFAHGVARTAIEDVQQQAGVSASQMYHYFTDKDDLIRAVIAHQTDGILAAQRPVLDELDSFAALERWRDLLTQTRRNTAPLRAGLDIVLAHIRTHAAQ